MHHPTWLFSALVVGTQGFRRSRCEEASSPCVTTVVVFYLIVCTAWCTCVCAFGCVEVCRYFRKRRKTIPYTDNAVVQTGAVEAAAPAVPAD